MTQSSKSTNQRSKPTALTPLGIIATFVALSETVAGFASIYTESTVQLVFCIFSVSFPIFIAILFFAILWRKSYVFYPPQEFGEEVDVTRYVEAMKHQAIGTKELISLVQTSISETFKSKEAQVALSNVSSNTSNKINETAIQEATTALTEKAIDMVQDAIIRVNITNFSVGEIKTELVFPFNAHEEAFTLLSAIYYQISDHVRAFTYGKEWVLQDEKDKKLILPEEVDWTDNYALAQSGATVEQFGLRPGMQLNAIAYSGHPRSTRRSVPFSNPNIR